MANNKYTGSGKTASEWLSSRGQSSSSNSSNTNTTSNSKSTQTTSTKSYGNGNPKNQYVGSGLTASEFLSSRSQASSSNSSSGAIDYLSAMNGETVNSKYKDEAYDYNNASGSQSSTSTKSTSTSSDSDKKSSKKTAKTEKQKERQEKREEKRKYLEEALKKEASKSNEEVYEEVTGNAKGNYTNAKTGVDDTVKQMWKESGVDNATDYQKYGERNNKIALAGEELAASAISATGDAINAIHTANVTSDAMMNEKLAEKSEDELREYYGLLGYGQEQIDDLVAKAKSYTDRSWSNNTITVEHATDVGKGWEADIQEKYNEMLTNDKTAATVYEFANMIGRQIPSMALNAIPVVGPVLSKAFLWTSAMGASIDEVVGEGYSTSDAVAYGFAAGALETATESMFDGLGGLLGGGAFDNITKGVVKGITSNTMLQKSLLFTFGMAEEGLEEVVSDLVNPFLQAIYMDKSGAEIWKDETTLQGLWESFYKGALTAGIMQGASGGIQLYAKHNALSNGLMYNTHNDNVVEALNDDLVNKALEIYKQTPTGKNLVDYWKSIGSSYESFNQVAKGEEYTQVKLAQELGVNTQDIVQFLQQNGELDTSSLYAFAKESGVKNITQLQSAWNLAKAYIEVQNSEPGRIANECATQAHDIFLDPDKYEEFQNAHGKLEGSATQQVQAISEILYQQNANRVKEYNEKIAEITKQDEALSEEITQTEESSKPKESVQTEENSKPREQYNENHERQGFVEPMNEIAYRNEAVNIFNDKTRKAEFEKWFDTELPKGRKEAIRQISILLSQEAKEVKRYNEDLKEKSNGIEQQSEAENSDAYRSGNVERTDLYADEQGRPLDGTSNINSREKQNPLVRTEEEIGADDNQTLSSVNEGYNSDLVKGYSSAFFEQDIYTKEEQNGNTFHVYSQKKTDSDVEYTLSSEDQKTKLFVANGAGLLEQNNIQEDIDELNSLHDFGVDEVLFFDGKMYDQSGDICFGYSLRLSKTHTLVIPALTANNLDVYSEINNGTRKSILGQLFGSRKHELQHFLTSLYDNVDGQRISIDEQTRELEINTTKYLAGDYYQACKNRISGIYGYDAYSCFEDGNIDAWRMYERRIDDEIRSQILSGENCYGILPETHLKELLGENYEGSPLQQFFQMIAQKSNFTEEKIRNYFLENTTDEIQEYLAEANRVSAEEHKNDKDPIADWDYYKNQAQSLYENHHDSSSNTSFDDFGFDDSGIGDEKNNYHWDSRKHQFLNNFTNEPVSKETLEYIKSENNNNPLLNFILNKQLKESKPEVQNYLVGNKENNNGQEKYSLSTENKGANNERAEVPVNKQVWGYDERSFERGFGEQSVDVRTEKQNRKGAGKDLRVKYLSSNNSDSVNLVEPTKYIFTKSVQDKFDAEYSTVGNRNQVVYQAAQKLFNTPNTFTPDANGVLQTVGDSMPDYKALCVHDMTMGEFASRYLLNHKNDYQYKDYVDDIVVTPLMQKAYDYYDKYMHNPTDKAAKEIYEKTAERAFNALTRNVERVTEANKIKSDVEKGFDEQKPKKKGKTIVGDLVKNAQQWGIRENLSDRNVFMQLDGFDDKGGIGYQLKDKAEESLRKNNEVLSTADMEFIHTRNMDGYNKFIREKDEKVTFKTTNRNIDLTQQKAISLYKLLLSLESQSVYSTKSGTLTSVPRITTIDGFAIKDRKKTYRFVKLEDVLTSYAGQNGLNSETDIINAVHALENDLMKQMNSVAKSYLKATDKAFDYVGKEAGSVSEILYGNAPYLYKRGCYMPVWYKTLNDMGKYDTTLTPMTFNSNMQERTRIDDGYVVVESIGKVTENYLNQMANYIGYGEFADMLRRVNQSNSGTIGLGQQMANQWGEQYGKWMEEYVKDINDYSDEPDSNSQILRWARLQLQTGALFGSVSVPLKQISSYWSASGVVDYWSLFKAWQFKASPVVIGKGQNYGASNEMLYVRQSKSDPTITDILNNNTLVRKLTNSCKLLHKIGEVITVEDYRTCENIYYACILDIAKHNPNLDRNSQDFQDKVNELFNRAIIETQPIYNKNARPENARTDNEFIKILSMFRTQQTQNFNRMYTTIRESRTALKKYGKDSTEYKEKAKNLRNTIAGQASAYISLALLTELSDAVLHSFTKYRRDDDEDEAYMDIDPNKILEYLIINTVEAGAGTMWFGDQFARIIVDRITHDETNEFYGINLGPITSFYNGTQMILNIVKYPDRYKTPSYINSTVGYVANVFGVPYRNAYKAVNSIVMWALSFTGNSAKYDDMIKFFYGTKNLRENRQTLRENGNSLWESIKTANEIDTDYSRRITKEELAEYSTNGNSSTANALWKSMGYSGSASSYIGSSDYTDAETNKIKEYYLSLEDPISLEEAKKELNSLGIYGDNLNNIVSKWNYTIQTRTKDNEEGLSYGSMEDDYYNGEMTAQEAIQYRVKYGNETIADATKEVTKWKCKTDTGYRYSELDEALKSGNATVKQVISWRMKYGDESESSATDYASHALYSKNENREWDNLASDFERGEISVSELTKILTKYDTYGDEELAKKYTRVYQWNKAYPEYSQNVSENGYAHIEKYETYAYPAGISVEAYQSFYETANDFSNIKDAKGNTITSKQTQVIQYMNSLNMTNAQKHALWCTMYSEKTSPYD